MKRIDLDKVVKNKAPQLYRKLPKFVMSFLKWLVCQGNLNDILEHGEGLKGADFAAETAKYLGVSYTVEGMENLSEDGRYLMVSNHPLGGFDGISYIAVLGHRFPTLKVVVNDILMNLDPLQCVFLPVNTMGRQKRADMEMMQNAYADEKIQVMSFPAGFCSRWIDGRIQDIEWKKSVVKEAREYHRDIVPMHFEGRNSTLFYSLEWMRRKMGMKFNIGLILLPWQTVRHARNHHYTIRIGKPIPYSTFDQSRTDKQWAQWLRKECYRLKK